MTDDKLRQLLNDADAAAGHPPLTTRDFAGAIHHRVSRRRQRRHIAAASIILCSLLALIPLLRTTPKTNVTINTNTPSPIAGPSLIRLQADAQSATIDQMIQHQRIMNARTLAARKLDKGIPLNNLQLQREAAARLLLHDAKRSNAPDQYRRVIELFPETSWAAIARQRL
jgi:hypothetical protein